MEQLSGLDQAFLCLEHGSRPMHLGAVLMFDPPRPTIPTRLVRLLAERAERVPRLAHAARERWWPPASMEWTPDPEFSAAEHVHVRTLTGSDRSEEFAGVVASVMAKPLPRGRPPWQLHVLTGLAGGRFALLVKLHHALADATGAGPMIAALLDDAPTQVDDALPGSTGALDRGAASLTGRASAILRSGADWSPGLVAGFAAQARQAAHDAAVAASTLAAVRPTSAFTPLTSMLESSARREWASVRLDADLLNRTRKSLGGTLHDMVLSIVAGGVGAWLREHGDAAALDGRWTPRAFIPVSVRRRSMARNGAGNYLSGYLCALPVNELDPVARLDAVRAAMQRHKITGPARGPGAFPLLARSLPAGVHRVATPLLGRMTPLLFDLMVTTVPVPDVPVRLDGAVLREVYPLAPLASGHTLSVAVASYDGGVHVSLLTDAELLPRPARLAGAFRQAALDLQYACELKDLGERISTHTSTAHRAAPRGDAAAVAVRPAATTHPGPTSRPMADRTRSSITVEATPAEVMDAIADFASYPQWIAEVNAAEVVEPGRDGRAKRVRLTFNVGPLREEQVHAYRWRGHSSVSWSLVSSRMLTHLEGRYTLTPVDAGSTRVTYQLSVQLKVPMLGPLKRRAEAIIIDRALTGLKHHVERRRILR